MSNFNNNVLDDILNDIDPAEQRRTDHRMLLAATIEDGMKAKGWKKKDLMNAVGIKNQSIITKWLSGTHNFTSDTLFDIQEALGINLFNLEKKNPETKMVYKGMVLLRVESSSISQFSHHTAANSYNSVANQSSYFVVKPITD
ncbi:Cro/C1-type helix-turn-helix domain [Spirosomataceae bacterium]